MGRRRKIRLTVLALGAGTLFIAYFFLYGVQRFWAHREEAFVPAYEKVALTAETDYETIFRQTGLGTAAVDKVLQQEGVAGLQRLQERFFSQPKETCMPLFGWFTREDRLAEAGNQLVDLQSGDILITLSTHSAGWRHGHAGLVIDENKVLECGVLGTDSSLKSVESWTFYTNYAQLRIKGITPKQQEQIREYALDTLQDVPYKLWAGFVGPKAQEADSLGFGLQCAYLVWYAWNSFGYDLDSDGGRLVSASDLLHSDQLEIVQIYGMNPEEIIFMDYHNTDKGGGFRSNTDCGYGICNNSDLRFETERNHCLFASMLRRNSLGHP